MQGLSARGMGIRVLAGQGAQIDTTTAAGRLVFGIFAALAEFERELIRERTQGRTLRSVPFSVAISTPRMVGDGNRPAACYCQWND